jgi:mRNA interferase RelE/StbE
MWKIKIHYLVIKEDFKKIDSSQKVRILKVIKKKLSLAPNDYGEPLLGEFKNYWKLRIGDYRVIYKIIKERVLVLVINVGIRRDAEVYKELFSRLKML